MGGMLPFAWHSPLTLKTLPSRHVTIMSLPYVPIWSNVIPLWSDASATRERRKQRDVISILPSILKTKAPSVTKTSRGVNPAFADTDGAIVMYFSRQEPKPGNVANTVAFPLQSTLSMFSVAEFAHQEKIRRSGHARGTMGPPVNCTGLEA